MMRRKECRPATAVVGSIATFDRRSLFVGIAPDTDRQTGLACTPACAMSRREQMQQKSGIEGLGV
jgi:hypothetical protein